MVASGIIVLQVSNIGNQNRRDDSDMKKFTGVVVLSMLLMGCSVKAEVVSNDVTKQIEEITMDETITVEERISKLNQLASDLSYRHGIGNGEYHLTSDVEAVFDAIAELKK